MKASKKLFVVLTTSAVLIQPEISFSWNEADIRCCGSSGGSGDSFCKCYNCQAHEFRCNYQVPQPYFTAAKRRLKRIQKTHSSLTKNLKSIQTKDSPLTCGQNALCGTLADGNFDWIYGQVGIYMDYSGRKVFIPLYVKEAAFSVDGYLIPYMIPKWNGKVLWMNISNAQNVPPLFIQPLYLDDDPTRPEYMQMISTAMGYKKIGADYSLYPGGSAIMYMYIDLDADFKVIDYTIDVYDQDSNISEERVKLNIGDEVQVLYSADNQDDTYPLWNQLTLEHSAVVTQLPPMSEMFVYAGYIPGRDIICTSCSTTNIDFSVQELYFRVAGYTVDTATDTEKPTYSQLQPLGKLEDNVCTNGSTNANCTYVVTPSAGTGGTVTPSTAQTVNYGTNKSFTVTANPGYTRNNVVGGTCPPGTWSNNVWATGAIVANCTVSFSFKLCGDSDSNNKVNIVDALAVARYMVNLPPPPPINIVAADVDKNGQVTIVDALLIAKHSVGLVITSSTCF